MAATVLQTLESLDALPQRYAILEVSADLKQRQQERIGRLSARLRNRVQWLDRLPSERMSGVVLANEVLDALPCERFTIREGKVSELGVALDADDSFVEREAPARAALAAEVRTIAASLPSGFPATYRSELCTRIPPWIAALAQGLDRGAVLLFDYGLPRSHYYHVQRDRGTLRCHFRQRAHDDPLINVGVQDITAWVDFTRVAEAADLADLSVSGFTSQAAFLLGTGIEDILAQAGDGIARARLASEARQLMMPGEMGEIFKAMALTRGLDRSLAGFGMQDLRHSL
jgi:SAM-dependent MidA family methyltransferase